MYGENKEYLVRYPVCIGFDKCKSFKLDLFTGCSGCMFSELYRQELKCMYTKGPSPIEEARKL